MSARSLALRSVVVLCALLTGLLSVSASASAEFTHEFINQFGFFNSGQGLAIDQSSGDVYVYASSFGSVLKYDSSGAPAKFSGLPGEPSAIEGIPGAGEGEGEIAVDNSPGATNGDIYLANGSQVLIFGADGKLLGELTAEAGKPWGKPCGVAVGPNGHVYVGLSPTEGHPASSVNQYAPAANPVVDGDYVSSLWSLNNVCNVAVDSAGSVYADTFPEGPVTKYEALQFSAIEVTASGTEIAASGRTVAIDPASDDLYVGQSSAVSQYASTGSLIGGFAGFEASTFDNLRGVAIRGATGRVYLADNQRGRVDVFGPTVLVPDVVTGAASSLTKSTATIAGTVNPDGLEEECRFEYAPVVPDQFHQFLVYTSTPCVPAPGSGSSPVEVSANLTGLQPHTVYHYRLVATNANGIGRGQDAQLLTPSPPVVEDQYISAPHKTEVTLNAIVNPAALPTTYRFEYGPDTSYGTSTPVPDGNAGAGSAPLTVSQTIAGLSPGGEYHYRIVAHNSEGTTAAPDHVLRTYPDEATADTCPNAAIRATQFSGYLPDCRAYELVSPSDTEKYGANIATDPWRTQSSSDGNAIKYFSKTVFGDAVGSEIPGAEYIARREATGWATHSINPIQASVGLSLYNTQRYVKLSPDLTKGVFYAYTPVLPGHSNVEHAPNLYLANNLLEPGSSQYDLLSDAFAPVPPRPAFNSNYKEEIGFAAASADFSHILFETSHNLTPDTAGLDPQRAKTYEWDKGTVRLAGIAPNGEPFEASTAAGGVIGTDSVEERKGGWATNAMSEDGSRVIFTGSPITNLRSNTEPAAGPLYMRLDHAESIQLNASERTDCNIDRKAEEPAYVCKGTAEPDPSGSQPAMFTAATPDESKVFFVTNEELTDNIAPGPRNLYMYEIDKPLGHRLTLISTDSEPAGAAGYRGEGVVGMTRDASYVYFTGVNDLLPGLPKRPFHGEIRRLYVWHDGVVRYLLSHDDEGDEFSARGWGISSTEAGNTFRVSSDGRTIAFMSSAPENARLAGYEGAVESLTCEILFTKKTVKPCYNVYVYKLDTGKLECASCNRTGASEESDADFTAIQESFAPFTTQYLNRSLSNDGRYVFFETRDALVPGDTNGEEDVYEYDTLTRTQHLISDGTCGCGSYFVDADPNGTNVFFTTRQRLVQKDVGTSADLYDARVEGGLPAQNQAPPAPCAGEDCQGPIASAPSFSLPASSTFSGQGNPRTPAAMPKAKKVKHPKAHRKKAQRKKHHKKRRKSGKRASRRVGR